MINDTGRTSEICTNEMLDWNGKTIPVARSKGGVKAVSHPYDNLIRTGFAAGLRRRSSRSSTKAGNPGPSKVKS